MRHEVCNLVQLAKFLAHAFFNSFCTTIENGRLSVMDLLAWTREVFDLVVFKQPHEIDAHLTLAESISWFHCVARFLRLS